jgi:hypothetical protein
MKEKSVKPRISRISIILIGTVIRGYQILVSSWLPPTCRFHPSCSQYMLQAVERFGPVKGTLLGLKRLARCHPFSDGGYDPLPEG